MPIMVGVPIQAWSLCQSRSCSNAVLNFLHDLHRCNPLFQVQAEDDLTRWTSRATSRLWRATSLRHLCGALQAHPPRQVQNFGH